MCCAPVQHKKEKLNTCVIRLGLSNTKHCSRILSIGSFEDNDMFFIRQMK